MTHLGYFLCRSGKMRITDPCYNKADHDHEVDAQPGVWEAFVEYNGGRVWALFARALDNDHNPLDVVPFNDSERLAMTVYVDSGQVGIFDNDHYPDEPTTHGTFYRDLCDITLNHPMASDEVLAFIRDNNHLPCIVNAPRAGVYGSVGCVSSSGLGDGCYKAFVSRDNALVTSITVDFTDDEPDNDDDSDPSWEMEEDVEEG